jgi:uncharacterized protein (DUF1800 family)
MPDTTLPPLDRVDPVQAWQPWEPTAADPWNLKWAGHLYRRAAFGATLAELREAVSQGPKATLERLLQGHPNAEDMERSLEGAGSYLTSQNNAFQLRGWWVYVILNSPHPLREKMTLFWHNHFATSIAKVQRTGLMLKQNTVLRRHALGKFRPFLLDISRDPAMLIWLDSNSNIKGKPNENYARELMELFSLGVGNYTEKDVREAARAFTGWHTEDNEFDFDKTDHDDGVKTVLKQQGNWNGDDIVRIVLEQPVATRFLVRKLYRYFISESASVAQPPDKLIEPLADAFRKSDYDIAALVKTMLSSRHFFSAYAYRQRIKTPVEFAIGTVRALWAKDDVAPTALVSELEAMGQELFAPPNVKGWAGGRNWLNTATVLARNNFAQKVAAGNLQAPPNMGQSFIPVVEPEAEPARPATPVVEGPEPEAKRNLALLVRRENVTEPGKIVDFLVDLLLQSGVSPTARTKLVEYLAQGKPAGTDLNRRIRETAHAIMAMPEYQLA